VSPGPALDQHLHNLGVAALGGPVKRRELVIISGKNEARFMAIFSPFKRNILAIFARHYSDVTK
jgi:hypothetical protein